MYDGKKWAWFETEASSRTGIEDHTEVGQGISVKMAKSQPYHLRAPYRVYAHGIRGTNRH